MPRIRTIKPEFWQDEKIAPLEPITRLVFLGLISMADDAGRVVDNVKAIDGFLFSETEDSAKESLGILARLSRILRYTAPSGQKLIQIANWNSHQKVDHPNKYLLPAPTPEDYAAQELANQSRGIRENVARTSRSVRDTTNDQRPVPTTISAPPGAASRATWLTPFIASWEASRGPAPASRFARPLRPLVAKYGARQVLAAFNGYLEERRGKDFCKVEDFAQNYLVHRDKHAVVTSDSGLGWVRIPDEPEAAA